MMAYLFPLILRLIDAMMSYLVSFFQSLFFILPNPNVHLSEPGMTVDIQGGQQTYVFIGRIVQLRNGTLMYNQRVPDLRKNYLSIKVLCLSPSSPNFPEGTTTATKSKHKDVKASTETPASNLQCEYCNYPCTKVISFDFRSLSSKRGIMSMLSQTMMSKNQSGGEKESLQ